MSTPIDMNNIEQLSTVLGLTGQPLVDFIREQNKLARDERAKERAENQAARDFAASQVPNTPNPLPQPDPTSIKLLPLEMGTI